MNLTSIRTGLETALSAISGLRVYGTVPDSPTVPCAIVVPETVTYGQTFDGSAEVRMTIQLLVGSINSEGGQTELDDYLADSGNKSIYAKIDADPTLGGSCQNARIVEARSFGTVGDSVRYYTADLTLACWAT
jgi:hypothetical protein